MFFLKQAHEVLKLRCPALQENMLRIRIIDGQKPSIVPRQTCTKRLRNVGFLAEAWLVNRSQSIELHDAGLHVRYTLISHRRLCIPKTCNRSLPEIRIAIMVGLGDLQPQILPSGRFLGGNCRDCGAVVCGQQTQLGCTHPSRSEA